MNNAPSLKDGCIPLNTDIPKTEFESYFKTKEEAERAYARLKVGMRTLDDAIINLSAYKKLNTSLFDKNSILIAIANQDYDNLRNLSSQFYELSNMYKRFCEYLAQIFRYDWYITPYIKKKANQNKVLTQFGRILEYFDNSEIKRLFNNIALQVIKNGSYYGILVDLNNKFTIQELPPNYCRSRFMNGSNPVIELNMKFFDSYFSNPQQRIRVIQLFPKDIQKAYILYKEGKLHSDNPSDGNGWYVIDPAVGIKFNLNGSDCPPFVGTIPSIIDLDEAQALDRKKVMQQLLKIIIQKLPLDKNGELIFDVEEGRDIHNTAVSMLKRAVGVDVLTTFADVQVADMADKNSSTTTDDLARVERTVFNNTGSSRNLFNTEGNIALEKSILNDEAVMKDLLYQFESLLNRVASKFNNNNCNFKASILETTIYNYKDLSKMYKEQTQIGYSKILPQVALGHSQSSIIAAASFENTVLHLSDIMIPPMMSSTMSNKSNENAKQQGVQEEEQSAGRPEKDNEEKSEKTIANREAMGKEG